MSAGADTAGAPAAGLAALLGIVVLANVAATAAFGALGVATPFLSGALGVPPQHGLWIPDAFLVAVVCVTPLAADLSRRFEPRRLLAVSLFGLAGAAVLAALAPTLVLLVAAVFLHGLFAAPIAPVTQDLVARHVPEAKRGEAMAWWTGGTLGGGLLGGTLGGPIAVSIDPRFAILVALPLASLALLLLAGLGRVLARERTDPAPPADSAGAALLVLGTLGLGALLNIGDNLDWFTHPSIWLLAALTLVGWGGFAVRYPRARRPVLDLSPFRERRFAGAALMVLGLNLVSTGQFETEMLGTLLGFGGEFLSVRSALGGLGLLAGVALAGALSRRLPETTALLLALAPLLAGKAGYLLYGGSVGWGNGLWPAVVSGVGFGMVASLLAAYAFDRIDAPRMAAAAACFVFAGQIGAALGLAGLDGLDGMLTASASGSEVARERAAFLTVFVIELGVSACLLLFLPVFRDRSLRAA